MATQKTFTAVNGVTVIEQGPASDLIPNPNGTSEQRTMTTVLELLLADDTIVYGCKHPSPSARDCDYTATTVKSVISHQRKHSAKIRERRIFENRSAGAKRAAQTKAARRATTVTQITEEPVNEAMPAAITSVAGLRVSQGLDDLASALHSEASRLRGIAGQLEHIARNLPEPPEALVDANELDRLREVDKNYQALKGLLNK